MKDGVIWNEDDIYMIMTVDSGRMIDTWDTFGQALAVQEMEKPGEDEGGEAPFPPESDHVRPGFQRKRSRSACW